MAYLIFSKDGEEIERRELDRPIVLGRAPDCDVAVHDILLSRKHCRFEIEKGEARLIDLASKNGTTVAGEKCAVRILKDGDLVQAGKTRIVFHSGVLIPSVKTFEQPKKKPRPLDPNEAMTGTVFGLTVSETFDSTVGFSQLPSPQPRPRDPASYARDNIYSMIEEIASSSWDSIYRENAGPIRNRPEPRPIVHPPTKNPPRVRAASPGTVPTLRKSVYFSAELIPTMPLPTAEFQPMLHTMPLPAYRNPNPISRLARHVRHRFVRMTKWVTGT